MFYRNGDFRNEFFTLTGIIRYRIASLPKIAKTIWLEQVELPKKFMQQKKQGKCTIGRPPSRCGLQIRPTIKMIKLKRISVTPTLFDTEQ